MNIFYIIFQFIILTIIALCSIFLFYFESFLPSLYQTHKIEIFILTIIIEFLLVMLFIVLFYQNPIKKLEIAIKKFLVGDFRNSEKDLPKTKNSSLNYSISFFGKTLDTLKNIKDEFVHGRAIKGEVSLAKEIQAKMLDKKTIEVPSFEMILKSKPAGEIGGDSFDAMKEGDNYYIYVGDATGHGVGAGLIMTMVNALVSGFSKIFTSGADILIKTNEVLKPRVKANLLMSLLLVRWNEKEKRFFMTGAGHEYLMIYKQKQKKTFRIKSGGVALGMIKDISKVVKEVEIKIEYGDIIVLYSDGITEAINKPARDGSEILFGEDRLEKAIQDSPNIDGKNYKTATSVFNNITINLSRFMGYKYTQLDDITLGVIQYKTPDYKKEDDFEQVNDDFITEWKW